MWAKAVTYGQQAGARANDRAAFREAGAPSSRPQALAHLPEDGNTRDAGHRAPPRVGKPLFRLGEYRRDLTLLSEAEA